MAEEFLDCANIVTIFKQMGSEAVAEGVAGYMLGDASQNCRPSHCFLHSGGVQVMPPADS
jgi:hypothetical protein